MTTGVKVTNFLLNFKPGQVSPSKTNKQIVVGIIMGKILAYDEPD